MISVYQNLSDNHLTMKDQELLDRYVELIQWGRENPVRFIEDVLGIPLLDYQRWLVSMTWTAQYAAWACSRNAGKSFLVGTFAQARALLFPKSQIHIMSSVAKQASQTFSTMENIIKRNIPSLKTHNTVCLDEIIKNRGDSDGFSHDPQKGDRADFSNGSFIRSVFGTAKTVRGIRSNLNIYDEAGYISRDFYEATEPFMAQNADFVMTDDSVNQDAIPNAIPNLRLYVGSASDTGSYFYEKYKEALIRMLSGDDSYFVADIDCEIPMHPTRNGLAVTPLLEQSEIDRKMRENEIMANREYHNIFDRYSAEDNIVSRTDILNNTINITPATMWGGPKHRYGIFYDPASKVDNAPVLIMDWFVDRDNVIKGWACHMENLVNTYGDGSHKPMRLDEQVQRLREIIYEYNGRGKFPLYDNVDVYMDSGVGGQAPALAQELVKDWKDSKGVVHPGLIDENSEDMMRWGEAFPHAVKGHFHLLEPSKYRRSFFEAAKEEVAAGNIKFCPQAPRGSTLIVDVGLSTGKPHPEERQLGKVEMASLIQLDLMKEEIANIVSFKTSTGVTNYGLPPEKKNKMHDDRAYVFAMGCWFIKQKQIENTLGEDRSLDYSDYLKGPVSGSGSSYLRLGKSETLNPGWNEYFSEVRSSRKVTKVSPFARDSNPFER